MARIARVPPGRGTQIKLDRSGWYRCSRCVIEYSASSNPKCPLCTMEIRFEQMKMSLKNATAALEHLEKTNRVMDSQLNTQAAIKAATDLLGEDDRIFLKAVLYRWRRDRGVSLKPFHQGEGNSRRAVGFIAEWRGQEPEGHTCSSMGGRAIATYFEEAGRTVGSAQAMAILLRGTQHLLPGGQE